MTAYAYPGTSATTWEMLPGYKKLIVWQKASELAVITHEATSHFGPAYNRFRGQIIDSAESVPANIADGYSGSSLGNYILLNSLRKKQADKSWDQSYGLRDSSPTYIIADEIAAFHAEHPEFFAPHM